MAPKLSEQELELLTEEEREGLLEDEEDEGDGGDSDADAGAGADGDDSDEADDDEQDAGKKDVAADVDGGDEADQQQQAAPSADAAAAADSAAAAADQVEAEAEPTPRWILPADVQEKAQALEDQKDELAKKFDDGELTGEEYRAQQKALDAQSRAIDRRIIAAEVARDTAVEKWGSDVAAFIGDNPQYAKGSVLHGLLDTEVRKLQAESANPFSPRLLAKAHEAISQQIESAYKVKAPPTPGGKKADAPPAAAAASAKPKRAEPPPTLRNVPAADITDAGDGGEFAYLERLMNTDSIAYEKEFAKLSADQRDRFLAQ